MPFVQHAQAFFEKPEGAPDQRNGLSCRDIDRAHDGLSESGCWLQFKVQAALHCGTCAVPPHAWSVRRAACELTPARLFAHVDTKCRLGHDLVGEERVGGMEASAAGVAEQPL